MRTNINVLRNTEVTKSPKKKTCNTVRKATTTSPKQNGKPSSLPVSKNKG